MLINKKAIRLKNSSLRAVRLGDFSSGVNASLDGEVLPLSYAETSYNFKCKDGVLKEGKGIGFYKGIDGSVLNTLLSKVLKLWLFKRYDPINKRIDDTLIAYCENKYIYYYRLYGENYLNRFNELVDSYFEQPPTFVNYRLNGEDCLIASSESDSMLVWNGYTIAYRVPSSPRIASMAVHYERLFAITGGERNTVWFSGELDPTMWDINLTGAGYITLTDERGALRRVVSFLDYVYIFRDFGITRISAFGVQSEFSVSQLYTGSGRIYADTVSVCGDRIVFLASDGLYSFDGVGTYKIMSRISARIRPNNHAIAVYAKNKYYLACYYDYSSDEDGQAETVDTGNNTIIEIDLSDYTACFLRGADAVTLATANLETDESVVLSLRNHANSNSVLRLTDDGMFLNLPTLKTWKTGSTGFNILGKKNVKDLYILSKYDIVLRITADDGKVKQVSVTGSKELQKHKICLRGERFCFEFLSSGNKAHISNVALTVES